MKQNWKVKFLHLLALVAIVVSSMAINIAPANAAGGPLADLAVTNYQNGTMSLEASSADKVPASVYRIVNGKSVKYEDTIWTSCPGMPNQCMDIDMIGFEKLKLPDYAFSSVSYQPWFFETKKVGSDLYFERTHHKFVISDVLYLYNEPIKNPAGWAVVRLNGKRLFSACSPDVDTTVTCQYGGLLATPKGSLLEIRFPRSQNFKDTKAYPNMKGWDVILSRPGIIIAKKFF